MRLKTEQKGERVFRGSCLPCILLASRGTSFEQTRTPAYEHKQSYAHESFRRSCEYTGCFHRYGRLQAFEAVPRRTAF